MQADHLTDDTITILVESKPAGKVSSHVFPVGHLVNSSQSYGLSSIKNHTSKLLPENKYDNVKTAPFSAQDTTIHQSSDSEKVIYNEISNVIASDGKSAELAIQTHTVLEQSSSGDSEMTEEVPGSNDEEQTMEVKVIPVEMLYDGTLWSQFDLSKSGDEEMFPSNDGVMSPVAHSDGVSDVARQVEITTKSDNMCLSIRDITKREKDRVKKRELRANPLFREREKIQAKQRMQQRRLDPFYREQERQRDRERRQLARRRNHTMRERERERDKEYKKHFRYGHKINNSGDTQTASDEMKSVDILPCQLYINDNYSQPDS